MEMDDRPGIIDYIAAQQRLELDEQRVQRAEVRIANARTPFGRTLGTVSLWACKHDLYDSQEHIELIDEVNRLKALDSTPTTE